MFGVVLTKKILIMDNVFKYFNGFFKGLTGLIMSWCCSWNPFWRRRNVWNHCYWQCDEYT